MLEVMYRNKMQFFALAIFLVMSVILVMAPSTSAEDYDVSITDDMKFNPEDLIVSVGDTVTWTNNDGMGHTATSTDGPASFDSGNIAAGATWSFTFTEAGTYNYKCDYHSSMTASITVVESDDGDGSNDTDDGDGSDDSDDGDGSNDTEESPDSDNDGISDDDDACPEEDATGHDADADGCIDDSDNDGVKNDVDVCPFDPEDGCLANLEGNNETFIEGCIYETANNYNSDATDDDGSCQYDAEDSSSVGFLIAGICCLIIALRRR
ncbi:MAG TPA: plastocyanin/azurin family copper-binding protein [Candidatus Poseidoniia archaeon]|nr:plastocyanin/azurin family copper-binding protein [Candidatus Poseidoniia archaeon]